MFVTKTFKHFGFLRRDDFFVVVHDEAPPPDHGWSTYLSHLSMADPNRLAVLVMSHGGTPSIEQRRGLNEIMAKLEVSEVPWALMIEGVLPRMAARSLSIGKRKMRTFAFDDLGGALEHLTRARVSKARVWSALMELHEGLNIIERLETHMA